MNIYPSEVSNIVKLCYSKLSIGSFISYGINLSKYAGDINKSNPSFIGSGLPSTNK
jgi:hypothetical protein